MSTNHAAASRFVTTAFLCLVAVTGTKVVLDRIDPPAAAAQGSSSRVERAPAGARVPVVDEYYPVKSDWIGPDRSIQTIKHGPTGSCYILVYPSGETLVPVEKDRCAVAAAPVER
jgi:hypothetical protein